MTDKPITLGSLWHKATEVFSDKKTPYVPPAPSKLSFTEEFAFRVLGVKKDSVKGQIVSYMTGKDDKNKNESNESDDATTNFLSSYGKKIGMGAGGLAAILFLKKALLNSDKKDGSFFSIPGILKIAAVIFSWEYVRKNYIDDKKDNNTVRLAKAEKSFHNDGMQQPAYAVANPRKITKSELDKYSISNGPG